MATQSEYCPFDDDDSDDDDYPFERRANEETMDVDAMPEGEDGFYSDHDDFDGDYPFERRANGETMDADAMPEGEDGFYSDHDDSGPPGRLSPTESPLVLAQDQPDVHQSNNVDLCKGAYEVLDTPMDTESSNLENASGSVAIAYATSVHDKRRRPNTPSSSPSPAKLLRLHRPVSSPHPPGPPLFIHASKNACNPRLAPADSSRYRRPRTDFPSVSTMTSSDSAQQRNVHGAQTSSSFTRRLVSQATPSPARSRVLPLHSHDPIDASLDEQEATHLAVDPWEGRRSGLRDSHRAPDKWYQLYDILEIGTIPTPEQCADAPPAQKLLAKVPIWKSLRKNSILGHFYASYSNTEFQCQVVGDSGDICGQIYKKSGGGSARTNHIVNRHSALDYAVREFRNYQRMVQSIVLPWKPDEGEVPCTSSRLKFQIARDEFIIKNTKQPLPQEQDIFEDMLLKFAIVAGETSFVESDVFKDICKYLNPLYKVPTVDALKRKLDSSKGPEASDQKAHSSTRRS
ncbi:hypothetical protein BG011_000008 [Mortierella polycephala]|uniref:Uncharacterized protein n=1 Tax=Mortierella polycephala TaxID=41804 RepID=A0A9P6QJQ6_9FUNG|nr:hypothetical protein BG011_000008 [Mortierella polycephala]